MVVGDIAPSMSRAEIIWVIYEPLAVATRPLVSLKLSLNMQRAKKDYEIAMFDLIPRVWFQEYFIHLDENLCY